jgi:hypothetical protein
MSAGRRRRRLDWVFPKGPVTIRSRAGSATAARCADSCSTRPKDEDDLFER